MKTLISQTRRHLCHELSGRCSRRRWRTPKARVISFASRPFGHDRRTKLFRNEVAHLSAAAHELARDREGGVDVTMGTDINDGNFSHAYIFFCDVLVVAPEAITFSI